MQYAGVPPYWRCTPSLRQVRSFCFSVYRAELTITALSGSIDLFLAIYPATVLWKLQMNRKKKIGLSVTLGLGVM